MCSRRVIMVSPPFLGVIRRAEAVYLQGGRKMEMAELPIEMARTKLRREEVNGAA